MSVQPFRVSIPKADLEDLQERLARTRWPEEIENDNLRRLARARVSGTS